MGKRSLGVVLVLAGFTELGCATGSKYTNFTAATLDSDPLVQTYREPATAFNAYHTFSVFPYSLVAADTTGNEILDRQLLFALRNRFEAKGYRFVALNEYPDFLVTMKASSDHRDIDVPARALQLPVWVPGTTITSVGSATSFGSFTGIGRNSYQWGQYAGTATATTTTYVPGYVATQAYTMPGYTDGFEVSSVTVSAFDGRTLERVWLGVGVGTSRNPDVRVSTQAVVGRALMDFPNAILPDDSDLYVADRELGFRWLVLTGGGNDYLPAIWSLTKGGPAAKAGLRPDDMIWSVNGVQVMNKSFREVADLITKHGVASGPTRLKVYRTGQWITTDLTPARARLR